MYTDNRKTTAARIAALILAGTLLAGAAPALAVNSSNGAKLTAFAPSLKAQVPAAKFQVAASTSTAMSTAAPMAAAPVKALVAPAAVKSAATKSSTVTKRSAAGAGSEQAQAKAILAGLIAKYPILQGTTVSFGDARGYQAIALYKSGRIIINPAHTSSLSRILNHEVWHVIDWRDNGSIDWGENIPPSQ
ncbi:MAG: hypothetical protein KJ747_11050 [Actinobacteria bacterium]|nr:hypothetical protein [Actinomycetota bacterium]MCG2806908.1 hypothetical protein [Coriobacteriia bacterium]